MGHLSGQDILRIWERGLAQHWIDRALTILAVALPNIEYTTLANLSIGKRDDLLFAIREQTFGPRLNSRITCPACQEQLEFSFDATGVGMSGKIEIDGPESVRQVWLAGYEVQFRLPTSVDLASLIGNGGNTSNTNVKNTGNERYEANRDPAAARNQLIQQCLLAVLKDSAAVHVPALPETVITGLADHMAECDPHAQVDLVLDCLSCGHIWQTTFDIVSFFWTEISTQARRLFNEVDMLARAYGWREADILSMSTARRHAYIQMVRS